MVIQLKISLCVWEKVWALLLQVFVDLLYGYSDFLHRRKKYTEC